MSRFTCPTGISFTISPINQTLLYIITWWMWSTLQVNLSSLLIFVLSSHIGKMQVTMPTQKSAGVLFGLLFLVWLLLESVDMQFTNTESGDTWTLRFVLSWRNTCRWIIKQRSLIIPVPMHMHMPLDNQAEVPMRMLLADICVYMIPTSAQ